MTPENLVLRPNCLLTRSPLLFVSGPRSLFAPDKMAAGLQTFLLAHGFQIENLWLPFRSKQQRETLLSQWMQKHQAKSFHFIIAAPTWRELQKPLEEFMHPHSTLTVISPSLSPTTSGLGNLKIHSFLVKPVSPIPFSYRLHQFFTRIMGAEALPYEQTLLREDTLIYDRFLDHCIELAENEFKDLTSRM